MDQKNRRLHDCTALNAYKRTRAGSPAREPSLKSVLGLRGIGVSYRLGHTSLKLQCLSGSSSVYHLFIVSSRSIMRRVDERGFEFY